MNLSAQIDPADIRALNRVTNRMARAMPKETAEVVTETARVTIRMAYRATPSARKTTIWAWADASRTKAIKVPRRATPGARYAKACWIPSLAKLGARTSDRPAKDGTYRDARRGLVPVFESNNNCPYIEQLDSGGSLDPIPPKPFIHPAKPANIGSRAVVNGGKELNRRMDRFASRQQSFWSS